MPPRRLRLDAELVRRGLAPSRERAAQLIADGRVRVSGVIATKAATGVTTDAAIVVTESTSMGMKKLWSMSLVPSLVVPERSKFAAAICVPFAGSV